MAETVRVLGKGQLVIGQSDDEQRFDADATKVTLNPKADSDDPIDFLDGHSESAAQTVKWTLEGTIKENFSKTGLQAWCFTNKGKTMPFKFWPNNEGDLGFQGSVLIAPMAIGGDVKKKNDQDFSFDATDVELLETKPVSQTLSSTDESNGETVGSRD